MATNNFDFDKGMYGAENKQDTALNHQPTPFGISQMMQSGTVNDLPPTKQPDSSNVPQSSMDQVVPPIQSKITKDTIRKGQEILKKYKDGKKNLEDRVVKNEKWWKIRHWDLLKTEEFRDDPKPASGWLFNTIISKHADYMDSYPTTDILPREVGDVEEAKRLTSIVPVIMAQNEFKKVYSAEVWNKLKHGTGIYGIYWDSSKLNGLGDIDIKSIDLLTIFWEPGVMDIQKSENLFTVELIANNIIENTYPQARGNLSKAHDSTLKKYWYDENIDTIGKTAVVDWYYHKTVNGKKTLQYIKFADDIVLYASEDDPKYAERGFYDHGKYPFVFDVLFPDVGMPTGFGFVDVCKNSQTSIDIYNNCFEKNLQYTCSPRYFDRTDGGINEDDLRNPNQLLIKVNGNLGEDALRPVDPPNSITGNYLSIYEQKITEMKETAGNRDATTGGTTSGVTAASAIAAMQESAGKTSRDQISTSYEAYKSVVYLVIELIRQFYDMPRQFRITGEKGQQEFTQYTNDGLQPQSQGFEYGVDMGFRLPVFDIDVKAEKESAYTQMSQNELALQFYNLGFFNPENVDQALSCLDMMEFQGKSQVTGKIQENGTMYQKMLEMYQQMIQMGEMIDQLSNGQTAMADEVANQVNAFVGGGAPATVGSGEVSLDTGGAGIVEKAKAQAQATTAPR